MLYIFSETVQEMFFLNPSFQIYLISMATSQSISNKTGWTYALYFKVYHKVNSQ